MKPRVLVCHIDRRNVFRQPPEQRRTRAIVTLIGCAAMLHAVWLVAQHYVR